MATSPLELATIRARFPALSSAIAFFDGPGGTQRPQAVIDAIAGYLRESHANLRGALAAGRGTAPPRAPPRRPAAATRSYTAPTRLPRASSAAGPGRRSSART